MDYYLLLLIASLFAETVVSSYLPQNEFGPIPASNIDAIINSQPKQQLQSIPLDSDSVGGSDDHLGTGEGTRVSLNHYDRPVHASNGYQPLHHQNLSPPTCPIRIPSRQHKPQSFPHIPNSLLPVADSTVVPPRREKYTAMKCWISKP